MSPRFSASVLAITLFTGCNQLGPSAISNGRSLYNQAIITSGDQQTLAMIVRIRYGESMGMLAVSSVTANIRVRAAAGTEAQVWGSDLQTAGNLIPLSASISYEENPTISYTPIDGAQYVRELLSPIPIDLAFLILEVSPDEDRNMMALIEAVNDVRNPAFLADRDERDDRFLRFVELVIELSKAGSMNWARMSDEGQDFALVISRYAPDHTGTVIEFLDLVGAPADAVETGQDVILPTWLSDGTTTRQGLAIKTRSIFDLLSIAGASMDVPPEHVESGWAESYPALGAVRGLIRIRCSESVPDDAMVAVEQHGCWYYIEATDSTSKDFFRLLQTLVSVRIAESAKTRAQLPVLTVPVSR